MPLEFLHLLRCSPSTPRTTRRSRCSTASWGPQSVILPISDFPMVSGFRLPCLSRTRCCLGVRRVASLAFPAFLASAASTLSLQASILTGCSGSIPDCHFLQAYLLDWSALFGTPPDQLPPKQTFWDRPVVASDRAPPQLILPCRVLAVWWRWQPLARRQNTLLCRVTMISSRSRSRPWVLSMSRPLLFCTILVGEFRSWAGRTESLSFCFSAFQSASSALTLFFWMTVSCRPTTRISVCFRL